MISIAVQKTRVFEKLRKLVAAFDGLASGVVLGRALVKSTHYLEGRIKGELAAHVRTGTALATARTTGSPSLIRTRLKAYTLAGHFKPGSKSPPRGKPAGHLKWSFFKGIPITAIRRIQSIYGTEIRKALKE